MGVRARRARAPRCRLGVDQLLALLVAAVLAARRDLGAQALQVCCQAGAVGGCGGGSGLSIARAWRAAGSGLAAWGCGPPVWPGLRTAAQLAAGRGCGLDAGCGYGLRAARGRGGCGAVAAAHSRGSSARPPPPPAGSASASRRRPTEHGTGAGADRGPGQGCGLAMRVVGCGIGMQGGAKKGWHGAAEARVRMRPPREAAAVCEPRARSGRLAAADRDRPTDPMRSCQTTDPCRQGVGCENTSGSGAGRTGLLALLGALACRAVVG